MTDIIERLRDFMEQEAHSCSMDFGCVTAGPYVSDEDVRYIVESIKEAIVCQ